MIIKSQYLFENNDKNYYFKLMNEKKLSLRKLSELFNYSPSYLSMVFNGKKSINQDIYNKINIVINSYQL